MVEKLDINNEVSLIYNSCHRPVTSLSIAVNHYEENNTKG